MDLHAQDITTDRLRLRLFEERDAEWIAREIANPKVHRWLTSVPRPYALSDAVEYLEIFLKDVGHRVIEFQGKPQGVVSITGDSGSKKPPELGYWLMEAAWGNGYMTEAAGAIVDWHQGAFRSTILSGWIKGNAASENVLRKLGFEDDAVQETYAHYHSGPVQVIRVKRDPT